MLWGVPSFLLGAATCVVFQGLDFAPTAISNRLVDVGIAFCALPLPLGAFFCAVRAVRWLLLAAWPASLGIFASEREMTFRLGPFGTKAFDARRLLIRYPSELPEDDHGGFERFLPVEEQFATLLPVITHPDSAEPLNLLILRVAGADEATLACHLRPAIARWRGEESTPTDT
jgi:hypothetical protein